MKERNSITDRLAIWTLLFLLLATFSCPAAAPAGSSSSKQIQSIDFNRDIRPIFSENCYACHGPDKDKRKAGLRLDRKEEAFKKLDSGGFALVPGDVSKSKMIEMVTTEDEDDRMPPSK